MGWLHRWTQFVLCYLKVRLEHVWGRGFSSQAQTVLLGVRLEVEIFHAVTRGRSDCHYCETVVLKKPSAERAAAICSKFPPAQPLQLLPILPSPLSSCYYLPALNLGRKLDSFFCTEQHINKTRRLSASDI